MQQASFENNNGIDAYRSNNRKSAAKGEDDKRKGILGIAPALS